MVVLYWYNRLSALERSKCQDYSTSDTELRYLYCVTGEEVRLSYVVEPHVGM